METNLNWDRSIAMTRRCLNCMKEFTIPSDGEKKLYVCPHCRHTEGTPPKEIYHLYPGTILSGRYVIGTVLGFGGFGVTYKAWDNTLGTVVAVKEYYPTGLVQRVPGQKAVIVYEGSRRTEYYTGLNRFLDEARNMAKFSDNPNIVHVENFFEENETAYIVMEYLDGISLKGFLKQEHGKIDWETAVEIICSIIDALRALHKASILHRDISPDNIFLCDGGKIKLIDFGAARFSDEEKEVTRSIILKPGFAPPEQYQSKSKQGPWTDIYALSATLYRLVTGVLPDESVNRVVEDEVVDPVNIDNNIPDYLSKAIMKGMALNADLRFRNVDEFKEAIQNKTKVLDVKEELKHRKRKRIIGIAAAVLVLLVGGLMVINIYKNKKSQVILEEADVTIWLCIDENENADEEKRMILDMSEKYLSDQGEVTIDVQCIPADEYNQRLEDAIATDDMPVLYESDAVSQQVLDNAIDVEEVFEYLEYGQDEYYFLDNYKKELSGGKQMPMGFNVPVAFVRRGNEASFDTIEIKSYQQISADKEKGYYIVPQYYGMIINSFGGKYSYSDGLNVDDASKTMIKTIKSDMSKHGKNAGNPEQMIQSFADGHITYYMASAKEFRRFNDDVAGLYEMRPIVEDNLYGEFSDMWSIDGGASEEEIKAAELLLSYMLAEGPQKTMHIANKNSIPLNKAAYQQFVKNNGKYEIVNGYLDKLTFYPDTQYQLKNTSQNLSEDVIVGGEDLEQWISEN